MVDEHKAHKAILAYEKGWLAFSLAMLVVFIASSPTPWPPTPPG